jgi:predicted  nucleic acid-binding Zn-ribbon protein
VLPVSDLEKLLSIFDQSMYVDAEHHFLNIKEDDYPEKHRSLIRRLQSAILEPEMRKQMEIEDGILGEFEDLQRQIMQKTQEIADAKREADQKIAEVEWEGVEAKKKVVHNLKTAGVAVEIIMQATGLSREAVDDV